MPRRPEHLRRPRLARAGSWLAVAALSLATSPPVSAASLVQSGTSNRAFSSGTRFYVHRVNGYYWVAYHSGTEPVLKSSPDGVTWTARGAIFGGTLQPAADGTWAVRYSGSDIIAFGYKTGDTNVYYRNGTLDGTGNVTWNAAAATTGVSGAANDEVNALIANGKPILWRADYADPGRFLIGNVLNGPTFTDTATTAPALTTGSNGGFTAGAIFPTGGADPNDLIVIRATTASTYAAGSHRLVAVKYDASAGTYDSNWYNVSTLGGGLTEGSDTEVLADTDEVTHRKVAAVADSSGNIHVVFVNESFNLVHYKKTVGFNDTWSRLFTDVIPPGGIGKVALSSIGNDELMMFYERQSGPDLYCRRFDGTSWGPEYHIASAVDFQKALGAMESSTASEVGFAWTQNNTNPFDVYFSLGAQTKIFYSVGTNTADLKAGTPNVTISDGKATFTVAQPRKIGVGDVVTYNGGSIAYIASRTSSTVYDVVSVKGGLPANVSSVVVNSIKRAFNTLQDAEAFSYNASHLNTQDLVAGGYQLNWPCYEDGPDPTSYFRIDEPWWTGPNNYIRIYTPTSTSEVGVSQRHVGRAGTGYKIAPTGAVADFFNFMLVSNDTGYVRIEGLEIDGSGITNAENIRGIMFNDTTVPLKDVRISHNIIHDITNSTIDDTDASDVVGIFLNGGDDGKVWDNIVYNLFNVSNNTSSQVRAVDTSTTGTHRVYNNTIYNLQGNYSVRGIYDRSGSTIHVKNNYVGRLSNLVGGTSECYRGTPLSTNNNVSSDGTATGAGSQINKNLYANYFLDSTPASPDLHLLQDSFALWGSYGEDLDSDPVVPVANDIDLETRDATQPDIGADEFSSLAAVDLLSFQAAGLEGAVELTWETGSELDNLGFQLYRAAGDGAYERITPSLIPGLGSSPEGARYAYRDTDVVGGARYSYLLEDVETTGRTKRHGPVTAVALEGEAPAPPSEAPEEGVPAEATRLTYGDPSANALRVSRRGEGSVELELSTEGFYAYPLPDGTVRLEVPGFEELSEPGLPSLPVRRSWVDAVAGRQVALGPVQAQRVEGFAALRPADAGRPEVEVLSDGTLRAAQRRARRAFRRGDQAYPSEAARLLQVAFQGEAKKAYVELSPLRWDEESQKLLLARRLVVRLSFQGREPSERSLGGARGRKAPHAGTSGRSVVARLGAREAGLHAAAFEALYPGRRRGLLTSDLRLSRQGEDVAFHVEPDPQRFGPGSVLYFVSGGPALDPWGDEAVYELEQGTPGLQMPIDTAPASGAALDVYRALTRAEVDLRYAATLTEAESLWLWDFISRGQRRGQSFDVSGLATGPAHVSVALQGASDLPVAPDHHVRLWINGVPAGETTWDGKRPQSLEAELPPGLLVEGTNLLELENVPDTPASTSGIYLDRFSVEFPRRLEGLAGTLEGRFDRSGAARIAGLAGGLAVDTSGIPRWQAGTTSSGGALDLRVEAGHSYLVVDAASVRAPAVRPATPSALRDASNRADYLVVGPAAFLAEAEPLLALRRGQGLEARAIPVEEVFDEFGHGEPNPDAIRAFLAFAYHNWQAPSPRYVVLLGDATYDPKNHLGAPARNWVPSPLITTSYLKTASDPTLAAVNGEDALPDLAIGRLPAASPEEARALVGKIVSYESGGYDLDAPSQPVVLVADDSDAGGDFEAGVRQAAAELQGRREVQEIYLSALGRDATRAEIVSALDRGAGLMSYLGHGGISVWASENVFNSWDVDALAGPQPHQPLLLTMNCMNGYFLHPYTNALSEALLKAEGKGVIAAFSPSGFSRHTAAALYHEALLRELTSGAHSRLGDAILAAQADYADTGAMPELLSLYHLLGDPALTISR